MLCVVSIRQGQRFYLGDGILVEGGADIAFRMEPHKRANFLENSESTGDTDGIYIYIYIFVSLKAALENEFMCMYVCDDVAFGMNEEVGLTAVENSTIGHISEVEEDLLRVSDVTHKTRNDF